MKYSKLLLLVLVLIGLGCGHGENSINGEIEYRTQVIDGCEYIFKYNGYQRGYMFSHKGNCKYCAARKGYYIHDTIYIGNAGIKNKK